MTAAVPTIVEDYVKAALDHAVFEELDEGGIVGTLPECVGLIAAGDDIHACFVDMCARLQDWVRLRLSTGAPLPVIDGIDVNAHASELLGSYRDRAASRRRKRTMTAGKFEARLNRLDKASHS